MSKSRLCLGRGPRCAQRGGATPGPSRRPSDQGRVFLPWFGRWRNLLTVSASSPDRLSIPGGIMRRTILLICALMLASCDQGPPPSTPVVKGEKGDKGDKGETGDKGEKGDKGEPAVSSSTIFRVVHADPKACAAGCSIRCNDNETMVSAICIRPPGSTANEGPFFSPDQARCRQASRQLLMGMTAVCAQK